MREQVWQNCLFPLVIFTETTNLEKLRKRNDCSDKPNAHKTDSCMKSETELVIVMSVCKCARQIWVANSQLYWAVVVIILGNSHLGEQMGGDSFPKCVTHNTDSFIKYETELVILMRR